MRQERRTVEEFIKKDPDLKAYEIATELGLPTDYVRSVKRSMRRKGQISPQRPATDAERLEDLTALFDKRRGKMSHKAATTMLMHNCYYRLRSQDDNIHARAIEDTYTINNSLRYPLPVTEAIRICEIALDHYMQSIDPELNEKALELGFPGAGLHYSDRTIKEKWEIKDHELPLIHMR